jgi:hypothetical protein
MVANATPFDFYLILSDVGTDAQEELSMDNSILFPNNPARKLQLTVSIEQHLGPVRYCLSHPSYFNSISLPDYSISWDMNWNS